MWRKIATATCFWGWASKNRAALGLDPNLAVTVPFFHPVFRTKDNGRLRVEMVIEVIQLEVANFDENDLFAGSFPFRAGVTLIVAAPELTEDSKKVVEKRPTVRFAIGKGMYRPQCEGARR